MKNILRDYQNDAHFSTGLVKQIKRTMFSNKLLRPTDVTFHQNNEKNYRMNQVCLVNPFQDYAPNSVI